MKSHQQEYPYEPILNANPFQVKLQEEARTLKYIGESIALIAQLHAYFAPFSEITSDDIGSVYISGTSLTFTLAVKESRFVHALAQFTGLEFEKRRAYDGQSISLDAKFLPDQHPLSLLGIRSVTVAGYLPQSCKVVVKDHMPLRESERTVYETLLREGRPVYETICQDAEQQTEADIPQLAEVEVPF